MHLNQWAQRNKVSYATAWRRFKGGKIAGATQQENGAIFIPDPPKETFASINDDQKLPILVDTNEGKSIKYSIATSNRRNRATTITPTDRFINIESGILPYKTINGGVGNDSMISARDAILLCSKAYFNFSDVRSLLDYSASVATGKIYLRHGNKKARDFFTAWLKKIGILNLQEQWYRERLRTGNCFLYRQDGELLPENLRALTSTYGVSTAAEKIKLPIKYILLNPADIALQTSAAFINPVYLKLINDYELASLRNPKTPNDQELFDSLPTKIQNTIKSKSASNLYIPLDTSKIYYYGYHKSDYEAFGISLLFSLLDDLEFYSELRKADAAINRTLQQAVLLIKMGYQDKEGNAMVNPNAMNAMAKLFENESAARVVVSTFDTHMEFLVPDIADILDPVKYQVVRERIKEGLNNILTGSGEKFSNRSVSVQLFIQQIKTARNEFLEYFLQPEIIRLSQLLGFKNYPECVYEDINLKDEVEFARIITRLNEIGTLTPGETLEALQTGKLPTEEDSLESQEKLRTWKDKGWYQPAVGGGYDQLKIAKLKGAQQGASLPKQNGRPKGTSQPKIRKKVAPLKASIEEDISTQQYDFALIKTNLLLASDLENKIIQELKTKHQLTKLDEAQTQLAHELTENVMANHAPDKWLIADMFNLEENSNPELEKICYYHQVDKYLGAILLNSKFTNAA